MDAERQDTELTDIVLCYQAMGVRLDASPAEIEQAYKALVEQNTRQLASPDSAIREAARNSLELLKEMYFKIQGSVTYRAMEKDHLKKAEDAPARDARVKRPVHQAVAEQRRMVNCPRCNALIAKGLKTCPTCKAPIYSVGQKVVRTFFSPGKVVIYCLILVLAASLVFYLNQSKDKAKEGLPEFDSLEQKAAPK